MRRALFAFSLAATCVGCVTDPDAPPLPQFDVRAQLQPGAQPSAGRTFPPTVWSDLPIARELVTQRAVVAHSEPAGVPDGELVWKPAGNPALPSQPPPDGPERELPKPESPNHNVNSPEWGKARGW